jgi:hypothetical protein
MALCTQLVGTAQVRMYICPMWQFAILYAAATTPDIHSARNVPCVPCKTVIFIQSNTVPYLSTPYLSDIFLIFFCYHWFLYFVISFPENLTDSLKGTVVWDFWPDFFHESIVPGPWIHMLKYFWKYFHFRGDIHKLRFFFSRDFRVMIPGNKLISGYRYPEINWFQGNNTWKSIDFRVTIPGHFLRK